MTHERDGKQKEKEKDILLENNGCHPNGHIFVSIFVRELEKSV